MGGIFEGAGNGFTNDGSSPDGFRMIEPFEHQSGGEDGSDGVGDSFAGDVGSRAVSGLEDSGIVADIRGGCHSHPADEAGGQIAQDVAEHIFRDEDVEGLRALEEVEGSGVDIDAVGLDLGELRGEGVENGAEKDHGWEDIGFIDEGEMFAALGGDAEGGAADAFGTGAGDAHEVADFAFFRGSGGKAVGEQTFGLLADDDKIDVAGSEVFQGRVLMVVEADGTEAAVELEFFAQVDLRSHFPAVWPADIGQSHGA